MYHPISPYISKKGYGKTSKQKQTINMYLEIERPICRVTLNGKFAPATVYYIRAMRRALEVVWFFRALRKVPGFLQRYLRSGSINKYTAPA